MQKRWRSIKHKQAQASDAPSSHLENTVSYFQRFKAQVIDTFMIYTPILYITTYFILGSAQEFRDSELSAFLAVLIYGVIVSIFISLSMQTPGCRAQSIAIVNIDGTKINFIKALIRFFVYLASMLIFCGLFIPSIWKKKSTLHDLICRTKAVPKNTHSPSSMQN